MNTNKYFIEALQGGAYKKLAWIIDAFTIADYDVAFDEANNKELEYSDFYPYQLVRQPHDPKKLYFADHQEQTFTELTDYKYNEPLMRFADTITLEPNDIPNVKEQVTECYGNVLVNMVIFCYPFGDKIPFVKGELKPKVLKKLVTERMSGENPTITVPEFLKHMDAVSSLEGWVLLCAPSMTPETLGPSPGVLELRDKLIEQHKDELDNPAVIAKIMMELVEYEKNAMKGTEAEGFYLSAKSYDVVRMKRFIMYGLEGGFGGTKPQLIQSSLNEGWDMNAFPAMVDGFRAGSYARGKETAVGGEWTKHFQRVFQNIKVAEEDCGTKSGMTWLVTSWNHERLIGLYRVVNGKTVVISGSESESLIGQTVEVRTPMLCKAKAPHFCKKCCGDDIASKADALHSVTGRVGSVFMNARMKAMHGKANITKRVDVMTAFS